MGALDDIQLESLTEVAAAVKRKADRCNQVGFEDHGNIIGEHRACKVESVECEIGLGPCRAASQMISLESCQPKKDERSFELSGGAEGDVV